MFSLVVQSENCLIEMCLISSIRHEDLQYEDLSWNPPLATPVATTLTSKKNKIEPIEIEQENSNAKFKKSHITQHKTYLPP